MDFVVVGFGVGALGVLLGVLLRGWLANRCARSALRAADPVIAAYERASAAECRGAGQAFLLAGGAVVLATVGGLAGGLADRDGALLVTATATVAALGIILWAFLHRSRHPLPARPRRLTPALGTDGALPMHIDPAAANVDTSELTLSAETDALPSGAAGAATHAGETAEPVLAESKEPMASPDTRLSAETVDAGADGASPPDAGPTATGQPVADAGAETGKIVAFVGRGKRFDTEGAAVIDDETAEDG